MKISNKLFAVAGAALLLASCKNNFAPTDFGGQSTKEYYGEEYNENTVSVLGNSKTALKIDSVTSDFTPVNEITCNSTDKEKVSIQLNFSLPITDESVNAIEVYTLSNADNVYSAYKETKCTYATVAFPEIKTTDDDNDKKTVEVTFTINKDTKADICIYVPNTVTAINGQKLDADGGIGGAPDNVVGEVHDCYYLYGTINGGSDPALNKGVEKDPSRTGYGYVYVFTPSVSVPDVKRNTTTHRIESVTYSVTVADWVDGATRYDFDTVAGTSWASMLSSHVALRLQNDDLSWVDVPLNFTKGRNTANTANVYSAVLTSVDFGTLNSKAYLVYKDVQNFKYNYAGFDVCYKYDNHLSGQTTYYENETISYKYGWKTLLTAATKTFTPVRDSLSINTLQISDPENADAKTSVLKVELGNILDTDKDGAAKSVDILYYDSTTYVAAANRNEANFKSLGLTKLYELNTNGLVLSKTLSANEVKCIIANGLYIKGEEGDTVASINVSIKQY